MYNKIKSDFEALRSEAHAAWMSAYMRNKFQFYGIPARLRRECCKDILKAAKRSCCVDREFLRLCWNDRHREFQYVALDYLFAVRGMLVFEDVPLLEKFVRSKPWWDTIDALDRIIGGISFPDVRIDKLMLSWACDDDLWVRRVAIDHQHGRKENTNTELLAKIIKMNFGSSEFFINKAIGWSLREYSKTDSNWVRKFLNDYGSRMNRLSINEASKYI
ncbi:MAG: DNA alkylation repair protein [Synergistes sp.]|nr:DNA alkylation repair protein [Synergistes sp.]